jgi:two-component system, chemotaxis family, CheB/CheR fusion protein
VAMSASDGGAESEIFRLREELSQTNKCLQSVIEELEATNGVLRSANEEFQSTNELLQSTNEELETAKEELRSKNEELTTLNEELQKRSSELTQVNNDVNNLFGTELRDIGEIAEMVGEPVMLLNNELRVTKANKIFLRMFKVTAAETEGQLVYDLGSGRWNISALRTALLSVLPKEAVVHDFRVEHDFPHIGKRVFLVNAHKLARNSNYILVTFKQAE